MREDYKSGATYRTAMAEQGNRLFRVLLVLAWLTIILFIGDPDIHDAIRGQQSCEIQIPGM